MATLSHTSPGRHCRNTLIWDFAISITFSGSHWLTTIFSSMWTHFTPKNIPFQRRSIKIFWHQKFWLYRRCINNLVNWWQKCRDVPGSYFDRLKHCLNSGIKVYLKIKQYFLNSQIFHDSSVWFVWSNRWSQYSNQMVEEMLLELQEPQWSGCLVGFYGISTFVGYLMPNPFCTNNQFCFKPGHEPNK